MSHIFDKTPENNLPKKKYIQLIYPKTDIFHINTHDEIKPGKRSVSMENIINDGENAGKRNKKINEVHFINLYKDQ